MLSAAITAGVAPLLFVQILYPQQFYTANLLLSWRWMIVIPVLIVVFYLLYLLKMDLMVRRSWALRSLVAVAVAVGMIFVGFCWTANYLLSTDQAAWPKVFVTGRMPFSPVGVILRMLVWIGGSMVSLAVIASWQVGPTPAAKENSERAQSSRLLGWLALAGLDLFLLSGMAGLWYAGPMARRLVWSSLGRPYLIALVVGLVLLFAGWLLVWRRRQLSRPIMVAASLGWLVALVAVSALREIGRLASVDVMALAPEHAAAAKVGGLGVFLAFAVINGAAITWCVWIARRSIRESA
jgi:hypothetical protein